MWLLLIAMILDIHCVCLSLALFRSAHCSVLLSVSALCPLLSRLTHFPTHRPTRSRTRALVARPPSRDARPSTPHSPTPCNAPTPRRSGAPRVCLFVVSCSGCVFVWVGRRCRRTCLLSRSLCTCFIFLHCPPHPLSVLAFWSPPAMCRPVHAPSCAPD